MVSRVKDALLHSSVGKIVTGKRERDLLADLKAANICGCGNCRRRAIRTKEFYDGSEEADKYTQPGNSPFKSRR